MKTNKVFRFIWRLNALIILVGGLLFGLQTIWRERHIAREIFGPHFRSNIVNLEKGEKISEFWSLGDFSQVEGTPWLVAPVISDQKYHQSYYSKEPSSVRNYMFLQSDTLTCRPLLPNHQSLIVDMIRVGEKEQRYEFKKVTGLIYVIVKEDTNHDKRLTGNDKKTIAVSDPSGQKYRELLTDIEIFRGSTQVTPQTTLVFFTQNKTNYAAKIDMEKQTLLTTQKLPQIP